MGQLSYATIISEAGHVAGRTDLSTRAAVWLKAWLRSQYAAFPWPFLQRRVTGVSLPAGTTSLSLGAGSNGVTNEIQRILDPIWVYDSAYNSKVRARIRQLTGGDAIEDETINSSSTFRGSPTQFKIRADTALWGKWSLIPVPFPDKAYLLAIDYIEMPADYSDSAGKPLYPNDRTLIQAVSVEILKYANGHDDPAFQDALEVLGAMTIDDRVKYGTVPGTNDLMGLDPGTFK